jgi:two-component sensor histidine kinase
MGEISISLMKSNDALELVVTDNGVGMAADSLGSNQKMGYRLIQSFVQKLRGTYDITVDHGTRVAFSFRSYQLAGSKRS